MPLVFSALAPHPPLVFPSIGKEHFSALAKTRQSLERLSQDFHAAQPDTLIILTPHGEGIEGTFVGDVAEKFHGDLKKFGDMLTVFEAPGANALALHLREAALSHGFPMVLQTPEELDYGTTIPLSFLWSSTQALPILPIHIPVLSSDKLFSFGEFLHEIFHDSKHRIALLASADLSHCLTPSSPAGYRPEGKIFDTRLLKDIKQKNFSAIVNMKPELVEQGLSCGYGPIVTLLGALHKRPIKPDLLSYEGPFGVGYAVINFVLP
jgi:aromatic ring-opening dioxygenase LigB subunit